MFLQKLCMSIRKPVLADQFHFQKEEYGENKTKKTTKDDVSLGLLMCYTGG